MASYKPSKKLTDKLADLVKKDEKEVKETPKKAVKKAAPAKKTTTPKVAKKTVKPAAKPKMSKAEADAKIKAFKDKKAAEKTEKVEELMHKKTHQDLINAAYSAAEELKVAPWVLLRAAGWGHFTDDRGKLYDGPMIDDIEGLDDAQKKALKKAVGL